MNVMLPVCKRFRITKMRKYRVPSSLVLNLNSEFRHYKKIVSILNFRSWKIQRRNIHILFLSRGFLFNSSIIPGFCFFTVTSKNLESHVGVIEDHFAILKAENIDLQDDLQCLTQN